MSDIHVYRTGRGVAIVVEGHFFFFLYYQVNLIISSFPGRTPAFLTRLCIYIFYLIKIDSFMPKAFMIEWIRNYWLKQYFIIYKLRRILQQAICLSNSSSENTVTEWYRWLDRLCEFPPIKLYVFNHDMTFYDPIFTNCQCGLCPKTIVLKRNDQQNKRNRDSFY